MLQRYRSAQSTMASHSPTQFTAVAAVPARHATAAQSRQGLAADSARSLRTHSLNAALRRRARRALAAPRTQLPRDRASDTKKGFASFWSSRTGRREARRQLTSVADDGDTLSFLEELALGSCHRLVHGTWPLLFVASQTSTSHLDFLRLLPSSLC